MSRPRKGRQLVLQVQEVEQRAAWLELDQQIQVTADALVATRN